MRMQRLGTFGDGACARAFASLGLLMALQAEVLRVNNLIIVIGHLLPIVLLVALGGGDKDEALLLFLCGLGRDAKLVMCVRFAECSCAYVNNMTRCAMPMRES